jgi:large subunit ribosomal protein L6
MRQQMIGSSVGFQKFLQIRGVGYTFSISSRNLTIAAGYSHVLKMKIPKFHLLTQSKKETSLSIQSSNLVQLNKFLSNVRS